MKIHGSSLHLLVKNEIVLLPKLLEYVSPWVEEIIVVDTGSTDGTIDVAGQYTPAVFQTPLDLNFGAARNFALSKVTKNWVFHLDADEWPTKDLLTWLASFVNRRGSVVYPGVAIHRYNTVSGEDIGFRTHEWHTRFFRHTRWCRFEGQIHESVNVPASMVKQAPYDAMIEHFKSTERQERQNKLYERWKQPEVL